MTFRILTLNNISPTGLARLPRERYEIGADIRFAVARFFEQDGDFDGCRAALLQEVAGEGQGAA